MRLLSESGSITNQGQGRFTIGVISPGEGSSGSYPKQTLVEAGRNRVFPAGTHMYLDHATTDQDLQRPEGSLRDLVGVFAEDARWDEEHQSLVAEARIYSHWRGVLEEMKDDIGVSIRASGEVQEVDGKRVVTKLIEGRSVDFVTRAGRGGRILEVLESQRVQEGVNEETRSLLRRAVADAHGGPDRWLWVRDHDDSKVWFDSETETSEETTFEQSYTRSGIQITLSGDPFEVVPTTVYVPKTYPAPAGEESSVTDAQEGKIMGTVTLTESAHAELDQKASRVDELETELAEARSALARYEAKEAEDKRKEHVVGLIRPLFEGAHDPADVEGILIERYVMDAEASDETIVEAAKSRAAALAPEGGVHGLGESAPVGSAEPKKYTADDIADRLEGR